MPKKRNDIVEEQRKARQEFLKLKQMQCGEIEPEAKPSEIAVKPTTFKEKAQNFWYHYKIHTILTVFLAVVIAVVTVQCATKEKYDISIMYFAYSPVAPAQIERAEEYFEQFAEDLNGDGKVNVRVMDCSFNSEIRDMNYKHAALSKVQAVISSDDSVVLYLIDEQAKEYFDEAFREQIFTGDLITMGKDFHDATQKDVQDGDKKETIGFPKGVMLGLRKLEGTTFEGNEEAEETFSISEKIYDKIKKQNG